MSGPIPIINRKLTTTLPDRDVPRPKPFVDRAAAKMDSHERAAPNVFDVAAKNFAKWDSDGDGHLTDTEIGAAFRAEGNSIEQKAALATLRDRQVHLQEVANDELGFEDDGITRQDLRTLDRTRPGDLARRMDTQFSAEVEVRTELATQAGPVDPDKPADLTDLIGQREYYTERYKDFVRRNPESTPPDYYMNYGVRYYDKFAALKKDVGVITNDWIDQTKANLHQEIADRRSWDPKAFAALERDSDAFRDFGYATHPNAYIEGGLTNVPYADRIRIAQEPALEDLTTPGGVKQVAETGVRVLMQDYEKSKE